MSLPPGAGGIVPVMSLSEIGEPVGGIVTEAPPELSDGEAM